MRRGPGFAIITIATLAVGIGLSGFIYTLLNFLILRPLPGVPQPDQLQLVQNPVPYPWFEHYRDLGKAPWTAAAFIGPVPCSVAVEGLAAERISCALVSPEYFATLRVQPLLGRLFNPQLERVGAAPTVVVTEQFWRTRLRAAPSTVGRTVRVNGYTVPILGVAPRGFAGIGTGSTTGPAVFIPATADAAIAPELQGDALHRTTQPAFQVFVRLTQGATIAAAEMRLDSETRVLDPRNEQKGRLVMLIAAGTVLPLPKAARIAILTLFGMLIALVLGLTCANLGGLLLARGIARQKELAIRLAIGAGRSCLIRQLLIESVILAIAGGLGSLGAANLMFRLLRFVTGSNVIIDVLTAGPDLKAVLFAFVISVLAAVGFAIVPALAVTRMDLTNVIKANLPTWSRRYRRLSLRNIFVVAQMAAAMMLLLMIGFLVIGSQQGLETNPGFDPRPVSFFSVDPQRDGLSPSQSTAALRSLPERLTRLPGVESVTLTGRPPLDLAVPGAVVSVSSGTRSVAMESVGPRFFTTVGATLLRGADFADRDLTAGDGTARILPAVINQAAANQLFGDANPLGLRIRQDQRIFEVAGVVRYKPPTVLMTRHSPMVFVPLTARDLGAQNGITVVIRAHAPIDSAALRRELSAIDARLTFFDARSLTEQIKVVERVGSVNDASYLPIGLFGLILACLGLTGVTAQTVQSRRKEIGIRMALGERRAGVLRLVMREGLVMAVAGSALGFGAASFLARVMGALSADMGQLIGSARSSNLLVIGIPLFLILMAVIACYLPARRSVIVDPLITLREE
jgi:predicted permease